MNLYTGLEKVVAGNRNSLLAALESLSGFDCDFNGENGLEYLWGEVWEANGFENMEDYESGHLDLSFTNWPDKVGYTPFT